MGMLAKIRRLRYREQLPLREIARRTGLSRNTVRQWLRREGTVEPRYPARKHFTKLDAFAETLSGWLRANAHRPRRERRTLLAMYRELVALGYRGSYVRLTVFARAHREQSARGSAYVPLRFALGEAFQFDWSTEYAFVGGLRRRLEVAHTKLCASRAFWLTAYFSQAHEMLFDAHARAFAAFGGVPARGIYDNMKSAVDKVGRGKARTINARFEAMASHYLFEPDFCNVASGWEKGIVEKNVQDRRRQIWNEALQTRWSTLEALNTWLAEQCRAAWDDMRHPEWPELTLGELLQDEQVKLMPLPKPFDGYIEHPVRVSSTGLIHLERNRYSVPSDYAHQVVSLRLYPAHIEIVAEGERVAEHARSFERDQTRYDWRHYLNLIEKKPGALRNGAPFATMPEPLRQLQRHLLARPGGDRVMATFLAAVPVHGLEAILQATEAALAMGKPSAEHVLNLLARLKARHQPQPAAVDTALTLREEPRADVARYDQLCDAGQEGESLFKNKYLPTSVKTAVLASPILAALMGVGGNHVG